MNNDDKLLALSKEIDMAKVDEAVEEMVRKAANLSHDKRRDLADTWDAEHTALCAITINYLNFCETDEKSKDSMHQAALNTYTQAMLYDLAADKLKKGLCEPTKIPF